MSELERLLVETIERNGPMTFADYIDAVLYHPEHGYYVRRPRTGRGGDYLTSPEIDPAFGELWAVGFAEVWQALGSPSTFTVVEIGPGEGAMAEAVLESVDGQFARALRLVLVERNLEPSARQRARLGDHEERITWVESIHHPAVREASCVFANEVLDNLPVHVVEKTRDGLRAVLVGARDGALCEILGEPSPEVTAASSSLVSSLPEGGRAEIGIAARDLLRTLTRTLPRGVIVLVDYGHTGAERRHRPAGTLVAYRAGGADGDVLRDPGDADVTAHVDWDAVRSTLGGGGFSVSGPFSQRTILRTLGSGDADARFRRTFEDAVRRGDGAAAAAAVARRSAIATLVNPNGLGGLGVVVAHKGMPPPQFVVLAGRAEGRRGGLRANSGTSPPTR